MRYLLDTHAFLWWISDDKSLSAIARAIIADSSNEIYLSAASLWEIAIKSRAGRLSLASDIDLFVAKQIEENAFSILPVTLGHALKIHALSNHHRDPFDQMLVAQCMVEKMPLISVDGKIGTYDIEVVW